MLRFRGGFSSSTRGRGCRGDSVTCAPHANARPDEVASAVCAPLNPTIPTRPFMRLPSPSPRPRVLRLRLPPRLRSIEGQPSHSPAAGAGTRRAVPRPAPRAWRPESRASPEWAARRAEFRPSLAGPDPYWSSPREGGPVPHLPSPLHGQIGGCGTPAPRSRSTRGQAWGSADLHAARPVLLLLPLPRLRPRETLPRQVLCPPGHAVIVHLTAPRAPHSARDCRPAPHSASAAPGRQDALRRPLRQQGFVGESNFALHLYLRLRLGDLASADPVQQELHQEVRKRGYAFEREQEGLWEHGRG